MYLIYNNEETKAYLTHEIYLKVFIRCIEYVFQMLTII